MSSRTTRRAFLDYFASKGHREVRSSPLVLPADPTLLFANAGMNQFKDTFTGREAREYVRAVSCQKCLRVSGKHNDLEQVGRTPRHHTFFEMLGNFSFGDYFKADAIPFAWELITKVYGLDPDRLWVTVFGGSDAVPADQEAISIWRDRVGVRPERILELDEKDNFWRMGDSGPCGPCSEIHYDLGAELTSVRGASTPATDSARFLEIWNLVFMQFDQQPGGALVPLPAPSIDTGMGLERITAVLDGCTSNYDTDLFKPILAATAARAGVRYGADPGNDVSLRVIADHVRALCFLVADGIVPANDKRGYVLRRVLRRAIRHGRKLGIDGPFLHEIAPVVLDGFGDVYPELGTARAAILEVGRVEEARFSETLSAGLELLEARFGALAGEERVLPGADLFRLYDTFGFPIDLARDIAEERGVRLDEAGFEVEMAKQRTRAQASWKGGRKEESKHAWAGLAGQTRTEFVGYDRTSLDGVPVVDVLGPAGSARPLAEGEVGDLLLEATPFYAESGGQVGDTGWITTDSGRAQVLDTRRAAEGIIAHEVRVEKGEIGRGGIAHAEVDRARRDAIRRNHTATHLLHAALREIVGTHVKQAGSLVAPDRLRFDFSHFAGLTERAKADIESLANKMVLADLPIETSVEDVEHAIRAGAMALFGEKYGERVRVVRIGDFSMELCGGTHCSRSGEIGLFKLTQEKGIASGTRRVEAVTGDGALQRFRDEHAVVHALEALLACPREQLVAEVERRLEALRGLQRDLDRERVRALHDVLSRKAEAPETAGGVKLLVHRVDGLSAQETRTLADGLRRKLGSGVVVLGRAEEGKVALLVAVTDDRKEQLPAGELVRELARIVGGGGGGRNDIAEAGGKDPARLDEALLSVAALVARRAGAGGVNVRLVALAAVALFLGGARGSARADDSMLYYVEGGRVIFTNVASRKAAAPVPGLENLKVEFRSSIPATTYDPFIRKLASDEGLDPSLIKAVALVESGFNPRAVSPKGARGLMQLMPATARQYGVSDPHDPYQSLRAGARHLHSLLVEFNGDLTLALAAYNAGAGAVRRYGGVPHYRETREYVRKVESRMGGQPRRSAPRRPTAPAPDEITVDRWADGSVHVRN